MELRKSFFRGRFNKRDAAPSDERPFWYATMADLTDPPELSKTSSDAGGLHASNAYEMGHLLPSRSLDESYRILGEPRLPTTELMRQVEKAGLADFERNEQLMPRLAADVDDHFEDEDTGRGFFRRLFRRGDA
jgi:hypothetical protein